MNLKFVLKFFEIFLFVINTFYFLIAIGFIVAALILYFNTNDLNELIKEDFGRAYSTLINSLLVYGLFLLFVGFIGCAGILSENKWILFVYFSLLFLVFLIQFGSAILLHILSVDYFNLFQESIVKAIKSQYGISPVHTKALNYMHYEFKCCGWTAPSDWEHSDYIDPKHAFKSNEQQPLNLYTVSPYNSMMPYKIPHTCCVTNYDLTCIIMHKFHEIGCKNMLKSYYNEIELKIVFMMILLNLFQLIILVMVLYLISIIFFDKKNDTYSNQEMIEMYQKDERIPITNCKF